MVEIGFGEGKERSLIERKRSVVVACDLPFHGEFGFMVEQTINIPGIGGYKIGPIVSFEMGLSPVVRLIRNLAEKYSRDPSSVAVIYDHQKAATDIPELGAGFIGKIADAGVDAIILFPFGGGKTQREWTKAAWDFGLVPIIGGEMTHPEFLWSQGGYIHDEAPEFIYRRAVQQRVRDFVVPGNKPEKVEKYRRLLEEELGEGNFVLYAPGFISQGGDISETGKIAGERWHAIVGSAIYKADDMRKAAQMLTAQIST